MVVSYLIRQIPIISCEEEEKVILYINVIHISHPMPHGEWFTVLRNEFADMIEAVNSLSYTYV